MSSPYEALYLKRCRFDPFSCREAIDCRTPLEDIFGAFLGELIERVGRSLTVYNRIDCAYYNWEVNYIYFPTVKAYRAVLSIGKDYSPEMILSAKELNSLLGQPLSTCNPLDNDFTVAKRINARFADITLSFDGLTKLIRRLLNPNDRGSGAPVKQANCNQRYPDSVKAINDMIDAIVNVRNPSAHRDIHSADVSMETIYTNARTAYDRICDALPHLKKVFAMYTDSDIQYLRNRYCPLLQRFLDDLDMKLKGVVIDPAETEVYYKALSAYNIILDESALASGHTVTLTKLADEMDVFLFADTLTSVAKATSNPDAMTKMVAKNAISTFYMAKENIVFMKNTKENDQKSILDALQNNPDKLFFVVTENRSFAQQILAMGNPRHIVARTCNNRGNFIIYRSENPDE